MEEIAFIAVALIVSLGLTWVLMVLGPRLRIMDVPSRLSIHSKPIPRTGGIAICCAFTLAMIVALAMPGYLDSGQKFSLLVILISALIVFSAGLLADMGRMSVRARFLLQAIAATLVVLYGIRVQVLPPLYAAIPLTYLYLVGGTNSMNLLDGMDGLAAGVTAIASTFFLILSIFDGNVLTATLSAGLLGASLGFLRFNLRRADIFMGDGGSYFLGFVLAALAVMFTNQPYGEKYFLAPILILGLPIFDTALAILRRLLNRKTLFSGDRRHLYDMMMRSGSGQAGTLTMMYGLSVILGFTALVLLITDINRVLGICLAVIEIVILCIVALKLKAFQTELVTGGSDESAAIRPRHRTTRDRASKPGAAHTVPQHRPNDPEV